MNRSWVRARRYVILSCAVACWLQMPVVMADNATVTTDVVHVRGTWAEEQAKQESQQTTIITKKDIVKKQAKSVEDIVFSETGVSRTVDSMGRVGVSIRGADPRHTLILVDGQPVMGDLAKYQGAGDELQRLGTENVERIEIIQGAASAKYGSDASVVLSMLLPINRVKPLAFSLMRKVVELKATVISYRFPISLCALILAH